MSWLIGVSSPARDQYLLLDPSLRAELIEQVDAIADERGASLFRSPEGGGMLAAVYQSRIVERLRFTLYFAEIEGRERRLVLRSIAHRMHEEDELP